MEDMVHRRGGKKRNSEKYDSTNEILDLLKSNQQFVELPEVEEVKN